MSSVQVGVIGCGNIARFHFEGLERAGARVVWVCDPVKAAAMPWASRFNARYTSDYREVLEDPEIAAVFVTTPTRFHKPICLQAIAAGKSIVCEKTLAESAADAAEIVRSAESAGVLFFTSYMKRFIPAIEQAHAMLADLGPLLSAHVRTYQLWGDIWSKAPTEGFFHTPPDGTSQLRKSYGGGILMCGGSHMLDLVHLLFGKARRVYAEVYTPPERDYDLRSSALLVTDACPVHFQALGHPHGKAGFLRDGWDEQIEIIGERGRLHIWIAAWDQCDRKGSLLVHHHGPSGRTTEYRFDPGSPFARAVGFFCDQIKVSEQGRQSRSTGYDVDLLIESITRSASEGRAIDVVYECD